MARLAFILSPERSGSTLLSAVLGGHRKIIAPPELHLLRFADFDAWRRGYPIAERSLGALLSRLGEDPGAAAERFRGSPVEEVYRWLSERCGDDMLLVDKTPAYARQLVTLERAESLSPHYVWLVRHPLGVAHSRIRRRRSKRRTAKRLATRLRYLLSLLEARVVGLPAREVRREVAYWSETHARLEAFLAGIEPERWTRVHFEDLVRHPRAVVEELCRALELEPEPAMLDPRGNLPEGLGWGLGDEKILSHEGIDARVAESWREHLGEDLLDDESRELLERLGVGKD